MAGVPAFAQDNDGEYWLARKNQIVVTATRTAVKAEDLPVTVSVKTDEQIADELVTDIRDLVRFEPGVSVQRQPARFGAALGAAEVQATRDALGWTAPPFEIPDELALAWNAVDRGAAAVVSQHGNRLTRAHMQSLAADFHKAVRRPMTATPTAAPSAS